MATTYSVIEATQPREDGRFQVLILWSVDGKAMEKDPIIFSDMSDLKRQMREKRDRLNQRETTKTSLPQVGDVIDLSEPPLDSAVVAVAAFGALVRTYQGAKAARTLALGTDQAVTDAFNTLKAAYQPDPAYNALLIGVQ